jgi:hypothetical protein
MISEDRLQKAMTFLAESDEQAAILKTDVERREYLKKRTRAIEFLAASGNVEERKAKAETSSEVENMEHDYCNALQRYEHIAAKRKTESLIVEVWRSVNANRRQGS